MNNVGVVGFGAWGSALAQHLARKGHTVKVWIRNSDKASQISSSRIHPRWKDSVTLDSRISVSSNIEHCKAAEIIVLTTPSRFLGEIVELLGELRDRVIVSAIKGVEPSSERTPLQFCENSPKLKNCKFAVLSGPSFAADVIQGRPVSVVAASSEEKIAQDIAELFVSDTMRVYTSTDALGVELGGIVKNIIAIATGISDSLGYGPSARAGLITRGLAEMKRLALALGAQEKTLSGLSGLGDLLMTATEDQSRNRSVGLRLGKGESLPAILSTLGSEAEGPTAAPSILSLGTRSKVEMPITAAVVRVLRGEIDSTVLAKELLRRPIKSEF